MEKKVCNIINIFKGEPKEPFTLNMHIQRENLKTEDIYNEIKSLYSKG